MKLHIKNMKIAILDGYTMNPGDLSWSPLEQLGSLKVFPRMQPSEVVEKASDAEVILTNKVPIGRDMMDLLTRLKYIGVLATGTNNIDLSYAKQLELPVTNIPGYSRDSVAQSVFAFILKVCNDVDDYNRSVKNGDWETSRDFSYLRTIPIELTGKTLGVVGYGDIGRRIADIARVFGMRVLTSAKGDGSPPRQAKADVDRGAVEVIPLEDMVAESDFISLNIPLTEATGNLFDERLLSRCKKGSVLINTARGALVNDDAVLDALDDGNLSWYAADVYREEPPKSGSPLIHHPKTIFTPHIAWASIEARSRAVKIAIENVRAWKDGAPVNVVNGVSRGR